MVRGLRIRQIFICVDLLLTALFLGVAALVAREMSRPQPPVESLLPPAEAGAAAVAPLALVSDRALYDGVVTGGLFGEAGRWDPGAVPEEAPVVEEVAPADDISETTLSLRLVGTVALSPKSPFAVAFIGEKEGNDPGKSYFVGEEVADSVALDEVFPREVILLNRRTTPPQRERLRMDEEEEGSGTGAPA
ncbi:MAG TPA: type II secretion system protein N, partial [Candidatus Hydrogenedentes bacterium]|nr:type II secretion system protein N [Candidatus Hydrogenedentota bacterium]